MADVLQCHSPHSVPVGFHLSPLHPRLKYLPLLLWSPVQHVVAQHGSLFRARDVENWQLPVDRGVNCAPPAWFFTGHDRSWGSTLIPCLPALVRVIIITIIVPASLSTSGPAGATTTTCAGNAAATCAGTATTIRSSSSTATLQFASVCCPRSFWIPGPSPRSMATACLV